MATDVEQKEANEPPQQSELISLTSGIVSAFVSNNSVSTGDLPGLIESVHKSLSKVGGRGAQPEAEQKPAVPVKKSVTNQAIVCLECGKQQKTLKRHLNTAHGMTPAEYRAKWNLRSDYPMVAPNYAEKRRSLAKQIGLGRKAGAAKKAPPKKPQSRQKSGGQKKAG